MKRLLALLAFLSACAPAVAYRPDPAFSPDEQAQIQRAADEWNKYVKPAYRIHPGDDWQVLKQEPPHSYNGEAKRSTKTIWIRPVPIGASVYEVALHEFGHALGLGHTETGVMMAFTVSTEFTSEVLAECRRAGACP